jgi:hypothetical protein
MRCVSTALIALRKSLGDHAKDLDYLLFDDNIRIADQGGVPFAVPTTVHLGTTKRKQPSGVRSPEVWVYLGRHSHSLFFKSWHMNYMGSRQF